MSRRNKFKKINMHIILILPPVHKCSYFESMNDYPILKPPAKGMRSKGSRTLNLFILNSIQKMNRILQGILIFITFVAHPR